MAVQKGDAARKRAAALGPCVALEGGPWGGAWYTARNFAEIVAIEEERIERMRGVFDYPRVMSNYVETDRYANNPDRNLPDLVGRVWRYRTFRERQAIKEADEARAKEAAHV